MRGHESEQLSLPFYGALNVCVADVRGMCGTELLDHVVATKPRWILDLRPLPSFAFGGLNRGMFLAATGMSGSSYCELGGIIGVHALLDDHDAVTTFMHEFAANKIEGDSVLVLTDSVSRGRAAAGALQGQPHSVHWLGRPPIRLVSAAR